MYSLLLYNSSTGQICIIIVVIVSPMLYFISLPSNTLLVFEVFKSFQASVERETGKKLTYIHAKNGGEYRGQFEQYCRDHGVRFLRSVPKTPQHNGVVERMN